MTFLVAFMYILSLITIYLILFDVEQFGKECKKRQYFQTQNWIFWKQTAFKNLLQITPGPHLMLFLGLGKIRIK